MPERVASRPPLGVDPGGWYEQWSAAIVGCGDAPVRPVHRAVVVATQQYQVREVGRPQVLPFTDVVCLAPRRLSIAAGERTSPVPESEGSALRRGGGSPGSPQVEDLPGAPEDSGHHTCVAREAPDLGQRQFGAVRQGSRRTGAGHESARGDGHEQVRTLTAAGG